MRIWEVREVGLNEGRRNKDSVGKGIRGSLGRGTMGSFGRGIVWKRRIGN